VARQLTLDLSAVLPASKPKIEADPHAKAVATAAVRAVTRLHALWPENDLGYPMLRGLVIQVAYSELARARGLRCAPVELAMPEIAHALGEVRAIFGALPLADLTPEHFGHVHEVLTDYGVVDGQIARVGGRRKGGVHFTPPSLTTPIVRRTLEPLYPLVPPERTLHLRICDPAVGAGAFLLALMRELGPRVLGAGLAKDLDEAKRLVAIHCAYGVDKCRYAVYACELALRLECRADRMPQDWLADNLKHGDALVGLMNDQIKAFHWKRERTPEPFLDELVERAMKEAARARQARMADLAQIARGAA
jgi:hypothetical protein